jgi:hypothetical protein
MADAGLIARIYRDVLGRLPDPVGAALYDAALDGGLTAEAMRAEVAQALETQLRIVDSYRQVLGRAPDAPGLAQVTASLAAGDATLESVQAALKESPEAKLSLARLYQQVLGRFGDDPGLAHFAEALRAGYSFDQIRGFLAQSSEAADSLIRSYILQFGTAPSSSTIVTLQDQLARGRAFTDVAHVDDRQTRSSGFFSHQYGYTIPAATSPDGTVRFVSIAQNSPIGGSEVTSVQPVPTTASGTFAPGSDTITLDLTKAASTPDLAFIATLDGQVLGSATLTTAAERPFGTIANEVTFTGAFGPALHILALTVADPAQRLTVRDATFDGNMFLKGSASTDATGVLTLFPHPGPQPPVNELPLFAFR